MVDARQRGARPAFILFALLACGRADGGDGADGAAGDEGYTQRRCDELKDEILTALEKNVERGVLLPIAIPCGENGIGNREDYFDPRASPSAIDTLQNSFAMACAKFESDCPGQLD